MICYSLNFFVDPERNGLAQTLSGLYGAFYRLLGDEADIFVRYKILRNNEIKYTIQLEFTGSDQARDVNVQELMENIAELHFGNDVRLCLLYKRQSTVPTWELLYQEERNADVHVPVR